MLSGSPGTVPVSALTETLATPKQQARGDAEQGSAGAPGEPELPESSNSSPIPTALASNAIIASVE